MNEERMNVEVHPVVRQRDCWNKCDVCGRFIPFSDLERGAAIHAMKTPDSDVSYETWETLCKNHFKANDTDEPRLPRPDSPEN